MEKMFNGILAKYKPFRLIPATVTIAFLLHSLSVLKLPVDWEIVIEWQDKMCMKKARFRVRGGGIQAMPAVISCSVAAGKRKQDKQEARIARLCKKKQQMLKTTILRYEMLKILLSTIYFSLKQFLNIVEPCMNQLKPF